MFITQHPERRTNNNNMQCNHTTAIILCHKHSLEYLHCRLKFIHNTVPNYINVIKSATSARQLKVDQLSTKSTSLIKKCGRQQSYQLPFDCITGLKPDDIYYLKRVLHSII